MKTREEKPGATPAPSGKSEFSLISNEKLLALYAAMLKCRMAREGMRRLAVRESPGLEAAAVGIALELVDGDWISPAPCNPLPCLVKGVPVRTIFAWLRKPQSHIPAGFAKHGVIPPTGSDAVRLEASGRIALHHLRKKGRQVVVVFASAASEKKERISVAELREFLRSAAAKRLPMLIVRHSYGRGEDWAAAAEDCGLPGMTVDRDDVVAVYRVASEALAHARRGNGPTLIECKPWRLEGRAARPRESHDPIRKMEIYLAGKGLSSRSFKAGVVLEFQRELDLAMA